MPRSAEHGADNITFFPACECSLTPGFRGCERVFQQYRGQVARSSWCGNGLVPFPHSTFPPSPSGRGAPKRGAGAPVSGDATVEAHISTRAIAALHPAPGDRRNVEQGPACGMRPWSRSRGASGDTDPMRVSGVRSPKGPLFRPTTRLPSIMRLEPAPPSAGARGEGGVVVEQRTENEPWDFASAKSDRRSNGGFIPLRGEFQ